MAHLKYRYMPRRIAVFEVCDVVAIADLCQWLATPSVPAGFCFNRILQPS
jgi:hypothetical protein